MFAGEGAGATGRGPLVTAPGVPAFLLGVFFFGGERFARGRLGDLAGFGNCTTGRRRYFMFILVWPLGSLRSRTYDDAGEITSHCFTVQTERVNVPDIASGCGPDRGAA